MDHLVEHIPDGSDRLVLTEIATTDDPILQIDTYLLMEGSANAYYEDLLVKCMT